MINTLARVFCAMVLPLYFAAGNVLAGGNPSNETTRPAPGAKSDIAARHPVKAATIKTRSTKSERVGKVSLCTPCSEAASASRRGVGRKGNKAVASFPCHPADYVDPRVKKDVNAAMLEMKRAGIRPKVTSVWRSSGQQEVMYKCSYNKRCRAVHPGLYRALPPGQSAHEAGLAMDISNVAVGPRGAKHVTPEGRRIIQIMNKHGFKWRYGLHDPVHFEADPTQHGYRNLQQAIHVTQTTCEARILAKQAQSRKTRSRVAAPSNSNVLKRRTAVTYTQMESPSGGVS